MNFTSTIELEPLGNIVECNVEAIYIPSDPDVGIDEDWDIFVYVDGVDVTYDISKKDYTRLIEEVISHAIDHSDEMMIDRYLDSLED